MIRGAHEREARMAADLIASLAETAALAGIATPVATLKLVRRTREEERASPGAERGSSMADSRRCR
jgi:hypothetical protein